MKAFRTLFTCVVLAALARPASPAEPTVMGWKVDGIEREALVFEPTAGGPNEKHPLVFVFHGHGGAMTAAARFGFQRDWPRAIVVCPQGLIGPSGLDPEGNLPGWQRLKGEQGDRDLKFVDAMLTTLRRKYAVDDSRVFAAGFSNGAFFSLLLWMERTDVFAGFTLIAAALEPSQRLPSPKPVLHIAGETDPKVTPQKAKATIAEELRVNDAQGEGRICGRGCTLHRGKANVEVIWHPGGHEVPPQAAMRGVAFFKGIGAGSDK
jgi:polyhydroxybutyrate depolymerase